MRQPAQPTLVGDALGGASSSPPGMRSRHRARAGGRGDGATRTVARADPRRRRGRSAGRAGGLVGHRRDDAARSADRGRRLAALRSRRAAARRPRGDRRRPSGPSAAGTPRTTCPAPARARRDRAPERQGALLGASSRSRPGATNANSRSGVASGGVHRPPDRVAPLRASRRRRPAWPHRDDPAVAVPAGEGEAAPALAAEEDRRAAGPAAAAARSSRRGAGSTGRRAVTPGGRPRRRRRSSAAHGRGPPISKRSNRSAHRRQRDAEGLVLALVPARPDARG